MAFREAVLAALESALGDQAADIGDLGRLLSDPPKPEMGDLAFGCFPLAKLLRQAPPKIAHDLAARIEPGGLVRKVEAAGPFVNFHADATGVLDALARSLADDSFFRALRAETTHRVMVEFSQPNTHKVFHVGHLRNVAIGDSLVRVLRARGHDVVPVNYYGDYGIDVAKCLWWLKTHPDETPPAVGRTAWLGRAYVAANDAIKIRAGDDEETRAEKKRLQAEVREVLRGFEGADENLEAQYRETRQWCLDEFADLYEWLGVRFEHNFYESGLEGAGQRVVDEFMEKGVFEESQGAIICDLEADGLIPALVRKGDGTSLYMTWDLALARAKFDEFGIERSLYVVGAEQELHFQQLFATLRRMGYQRAKDCRHVSYQLVMRPEGKMSSRDGTAIPFHELRTSVSEAIREKMRAEDRPERVDWSPERWDDIAHKVAVACLKYGMLRVGNTRRVIFKLEDWTNPEGDTGAYLLYSQARVAGIFRKTLEDVSLADGIADGGTFGSVPERNLLNHILKFPDVVARVEGTLDPSPLAAFVFDGAKRFSRFYQECPVLQAEPKERAARLLLVRATQAIATRALDLLGIDVVEAM